MLPPGAETIGLFAWIFGFIPYIGTSIKKMMLSKLGGYFHSGDMRYLSNCTNNDYKNVQLLYAVSFFYRVKAFLKKKISFLKIPADHSITVYRKKLKNIANRNNTTKGL